MFHNAVFKILCGHLIRNVTEKGLVGHEKIRLTQELTNDTATAKIIHGRIPLAALHIVGAVAPVFRQNIGLIVFRLDACGNFRPQFVGQLNRITYPGADANASGTAALLSLAEMLSEYKDGGRTHDSNVIFVAFDAKEMNMAGSRKLWDMIAGGELKDPVSGKKITKDKIAFMVNIDQIGSSLSPLNDGRKDYMIMLGKHSLKPAERELLAYCNRSTGLHMDIDYTYYGSQDFTRIFYRLSDQRVFVDNHIPAVVFTSGITMNTNKTWDTPENMDMEVFKKRISLIYHWIDMMMQ